MPCPTQSMNDFDSNERVRKILDTQVTATETKGKYFFILNFSFLYLVMSYYLFFITYHIHLFSELFLFLKRGHIHCKNAMGTFIVKNIDVLCTACQNRKRGLTFPARSNVSSITAAVSMLFQREVAMTWAIIEVEHYKLLSLTLT